MGYCEVQGATLTSPIQTKDLERHMVKNVQEPAERVVANVERVIVGKHVEVRMALVALLCEGHILIEDVPGVGKTMLAKAVSKSIGCSFRRIQFTPDLLPSDVTGLSIFNQKTQEFEFRPGPIMAQVVLADEINRATPKTQSALLECMEERQATIDGTTYPMPSPFLVIATQNPIEYEGTFALPEAQLDRFMLRLRLGYPKAMEEIVILDEQKRLHPIDDLRQVLDLEELRQMQSGIKEIYVDQTVAEYIVRLVTATREHPDVYLGASPRGSLNLYRSGQALAALEGRDYVIPDDIKQLAVAVLAHRLIIKSQASLREIDPDSIVREILAPGADRRGKQRYGGSGLAHVGSEVQRQMGSLARQLRFVFLGTVLVVAAFSTGISFLFFLVYLLGGLLLAAWLYARRGLQGLRAGYHVLNPARPGGRGRCRRSTASTTRPAGASRGWSCGTTRPCRRRCRAA